MFGTKFNMDLNLVGKIALITGGSHGIGLAIAISLAEEGCKVIICSRNENKLNSALAELSSISEGHSSYQFDALERNSIETLACSVKKDYPGGIDILVNNVEGVEAGVKKIC